MSDSSNPAASAVPNESALAKATRDGEPQHRYRGQPDGIFMEVFDRKGDPVLKRITNCLIIILRILVFSDVVGRRDLELQVTLGARTVQVTLPLQRFEKMDWVVEKLGPDAIVESFPNCREHLRAAIQYLSTPVPERPIVSALGWHEVGGTHYYVHAAGAIGGHLGRRWDEEPDEWPARNYRKCQELLSAGPSGPVLPIQVPPLPFDVRVPEPLRDFNLPAPPTGERARAANVLVLGLLDRGPKRITYSLLAAVCRAVIGGPDFVIVVCGPTGNGKTTIVTIFQQLMGKDFRATNLPGSWLSTQNYLEAIAYYAKDAPLTIDDQVLRGSRNEVDRANRDADRLIRGSANQAGRGRCDREGNPIFGKPARALIISTQEESASCRSLQARTYRIDIRPGDIFPAQTPAPNPTGGTPPGAPEELGPSLEDIQKAANEGYYAEAMAGFIAFIAANREMVAEAIETRRGMLADSTRKYHRRALDIATQLMTAFDLYLEYARGWGALNDEEYVERLDSFGSILLRNLDDSHALQVAEDPVEQFLGALRELLASKQCHLALRHGSAPGLDAEALGWRREQQLVLKKTGGPLSHTPQKEPEDRPKTLDEKEEYFETYDRWHPKGKLLGWIADDKVYLLPTIALELAKTLLERTGTHLQLQLTNLGKSFDERKMLAERDLSRNRYTKRFNAGGRRHNTLCLRLEKLMREEVHCADIFEDDYDGPPPEQLLLEDHGKSVRQVFDENLDC